MTAANFTQIAPWVALAFGFGYFVHSARESVRNRQRDLRKTLRKILRQSYRQCSFDIHEIEVRNDPNRHDLDLPKGVGKPRPARLPVDYGNAAAEISNLKLEGLSSPNASHLNYIQTHLQVVYLHWIDLKSHSAAQAHGKPAYANLDELTTNLLMWLRTLQRELERYIRASAKMDDGSYLTYLRYKYREQDMQLKPAIK